MKIILFLDVSMSRNNIVLDTGQSSLFLDCPVQSWTPGHPACTVCQRWRLDISRLSYGENIDQTIDKLRTVLNMVSRFQLKWK